MDYAPKNCLVFVLCQFNAIVVGKIFIEFRMCLPQNFSHEWRHRHTICDFQIGG